MTFASWVRALAGGTTRNRTVSRPPPSRSRRTFRPLCEALEDRLAPATFMVLNADDSGAGSLRQAILDANASPNVDGPDRIAFNIPGDGVHTINVSVNENLAALPIIDDSVIIDGYTQPGASPNTLPEGNNAILRIELNGSNAGSNHGLSLFAGSSTVRGLVINRFEMAAVSIGGFAGNLIEGNFLGTDAGGTIALGNEQGIRIIRSVSHTIGGTTPEARNLISGNRSHGVFTDNSLTSGSVLSGSHLLQGNCIGTDITGNSPLGNGGDGIYLMSARSTIGGQTPGASNTIAFNGEAGIFVRSGRGNSILANSIHSNAALGIRLSPESLQRSPVLAVATSSAGSTTISGTLTGVANSTLIVEFFSNTAADPSGFGEGESFLGSALVTTDDTGTASFQVSLPVSVSTGRIITATATASIGTTSQFSEGILLTNQPPVNTVPGDQVAAEDFALVIDGLSVFDDDTTGILTVTFGVENGRLTVSDGVAGGLTAAGISGNGTATLTLTGTQAQINATLAAATGLTYLGNQDYSGPDTLFMSTTDAGGLSDVDAVTIDVLNAQQQTDLLIALIADLGDDGVLNGGQENALVKKLILLLAPTGGNTVDAFINQVNAFAAAGILTQEQADELIASAESIVASMQ